MSDTNRSQSNSSNLDTLQPVLAELLIRTRQFLAGKRSSPPVLVPVYARDTYPQRQQPSMPAPSWWSWLSAWLRYHRIQWRWDIERWLARQLGRRWI